MQQLLDALRSAAGPLALLALAVALVALVLALRAGTHERGSAPGSLPPLSADPALDRVLASQMQRLDAASNELQALAARTRWLESHTRHSVQAVGLVRFNPFEDTGGNQSFALALLDADATGIVLSSLHSRQATRVYIKSVVAGRCDAALSAEETEALRQAGVSS
jgi:hypothetical protein